MEQLAWPAHAACHTASLKMSSPLIKIHPSRKTNSTTPGRENAFPTPLKISQAMLWPIHYIYPMTAMGTTFDFLLLWASEDILNYFLKHQQPTCTLLTNAAKYTSHVHASLHCQLGEPRQYSWRGPQNWSPNKRVKQWLRSKAPKYKRRD